MQSKSLLPRVNHEHHIVDPGQSVWILVVDPGGSPLWILVEPIVDPGGYQSGSWWIPLLDPNCGSQWIPNVDPSGRLSFFSCLPVNRNNVN